MRKVIFLFSLLGIFCIPFFVSARSGCCSWHGGVCGCGCCDGTSLSATCAPYYPECYSYDPLPTYDPLPIPTMPTCPSMSYYDSLSDSCKCYSGYVVGTDFLGEQSCVSGDSKCQDDYGYGAQYDSLSRTCECKYGYILYGGKCVDEDDYCSDTYSYFNSQYNSLYDECECSYGYIYYNGECMDEDAYCRDTYSYFNSKYNSTFNRCECDYGYKYNGNACVAEDDYSTNYDYLYYLLNKNASISCPDNSTKGSDDKCYCDSGYQVNSTKDGCVISNDGTALGVSYSENNPLGLQVGWLIKNKKFVEVFSVDNDLCLHWIINEKVAEKNFGKTWNNYGNIKEFDNIPSGYKFCDNLK